MKAIHLFAGMLVAGCVALSSCTTWQHTSRRAPIAPTSIASHQMTSDMRVDFSLKVTGESRRDCRSRQEAVENAVFNAIETCNVDIVVDPIYEMEITRHFAKTTYQARVVGFAGYYKKAENVKTLVEEIEEASHLQMDDIIKYKVITDPRFAEQYFEKEAEQKDLNNDNNNGTTIYFNNGDGNLTVTTNHPARAAKTVKTESKPENNTVGNALTGMFSKIKSKNKRR